MAQITDEQREQYTQQMRTLMGEVQRLQAAGEKDSPLTQRYVKAIKKLGGVLKRPDVIPEWMSQALGASQGMTASLGEEAGAGIEAMMPESYMYPAYKLTGENIDRLLENPFEELSPIHQMYEAVTGEPTDRERYLELREEMYGSQPTELEQRPFGERYQHFKERSRRLMEQSRREDPGAYFAGEAAGGLTQAGAGLTKFGLQKGATTMQNIPRLMGVGGAEGAVYGYGSGEGDVGAAMLGEPGLDVSQELAEARDPTIMGTGLGATSAGIIPAGGALGRRMLQPAVPRGRRVEEAARQPIAEAIEFDIERGVTSPAQMEKMLDVPEMTIADVSRATREVAKDVAATPTAAAETLRKFYEKRNLGTAGRLRAQLTDALSIETDDLAVANLQFAKEIGDEADAAYKLAYSKPVAMSSNMRQMLQTPFGQKALRKAKVQRQNRGKNPDALNLTGAMQSTRDMDAILREMNAQVKKAVKKGDADWPFLRDQRDRFERMLYGANDDYRAARQQYGTDMSRARSLEYGQDIFKKKQLPEYIRQDIQRMNDADREMLRLGVLEGAVREITSKPKTADTMKGVWNREGTNEILQMVFPDKKVYDQFVDYVDGNREMFKTWTEIERTATRDPLGANRAKTMFTRILEMVGYTGGLQTGTGTARAGGAFGEALGRGMTPTQLSPFDADVAARQAEMLTSGNLQRIMEPHTFGGILSTGTPKLGGTVPAGGAISATPLGEEEYGWPESRGILQ